jgi:hypothetical protein
MRSLVLAFSTVGGLWVTTAALAAPPTGCGGSCLPPPFLPAGALVVDGVAYAGDHYLGCDDDQAYNLQAQWVSIDLWYYYPPAQICAPAPAPPAHAAAAKPAWEDEMPGYMCSLQCAAGNCAQWCSFQQRCYTYCTPMGTAACYCTF